MPIDPSIALGAQLEPQDFSWTPSDVQLYHLALGAGSHPLDPRELRYLDDSMPQVLPTFATVAAGFHSTKPPEVSFPGVEIDLSQVVHGSQEVTVHQPVPAAGSGQTTTRITDIWDKGKAAVIVQEMTTVDLDGNPLWTARSSIFARGEGGFGGERGPSASATPPELSPDLSVEIPVLAQQALLYRMCGDRNPLHSDPHFASAAGFPAPILHGLCTYGMVCKAAVDAVLGGDSSLVTGFRARFAGIVFPGEHLNVQIWKEQGHLNISATTSERGTPALTDVVLTHA